MENRLPSRFNPLDFARNGESGQLILPVSHFKRFSALLSDDSGEVSAQVRFHQERFAGSQARAVGSGTLSTQANVVCQRCMKPMTIDIDCEFKLAFVASEEQADELPEDVDPVLMDEHNEINAVDFLEDELILQLPISTLHADDSLCEPKAAWNDNRQTEPAKTHKPFSDLGKLLKH